MIKYVLVIFSKTWIERKTQNTRWKPSNPGTKHPVSRPCSKALVVRAREQSQTRLTLLTRGFQLSLPPMFVGKAFGNRRRAHSHGSSIRPYVIRGLSLVLPWRVLILHGFNFWGGVVVPFQFHVVVTPPPYPHRRIIFFDRAQATTSLSFSARPIA